MKLSIVAVASGLALINGANAAISILFPYSGSVWYSNDTVALNWTAAATDATEFSVQLSNKDTALLASAQQLADQVYTANEFVHLLLPQIQYGDGYIVSITNRTNTSDVFAVSQSFKIEAGTPSTTTNTASVASASATTGSAYIPNAVTTTTSSNPFSSTTAAAKSSAGRTTPAAAALAVLGVVGAALAL
ncbi:uncharacterized protein EHS24_004690 [Apiotrichum porosum]|uniref:Yeast cell wall synthesis Kre9/Knh1-like N-terminal domain-containing protein n=1 Tax=Apiotrichum porosum TaxID=105984 RepID=A0A427Y5R7_9TREE|nr:uncharacterized protein EHS24_004690 [Apiotrichum porosum]RSH86435.1 hypothetical protein EHS24_004690 [Apiotrichum porosum]